MEVQLYGAEKVTISKWRQFQVCLNRARQAATIWSDSEQQTAIEQLQPEIHQVIPAKRKLFNKLFQYHEQQWLQEVGTKATGPRSILATKLALLKTAAEEEAYGVVNMTADQCAQFQVHISNDETEATTWSTADTDRVVNRLEREINGITSKDPMRCTKEFSIRLVEFEAWWQAIGVQTFWKTIEQCVIHFGYPKMDLVSYISESIHLMGSADNFTTGISEWLHLGNMKEAYWSTNKVNYIQQIFNYNDYMEETLSYLAL